jgi:Ice-binding-like
MNCSKDFSLRFVLMVPIVAMFSGACGDSASPAGANDGGGSGSSAGSGGPSSGGTGSSSGTGSISGSATSGSASGSGSATSGSASGSGSASTGSVSSGSSGSSDSGGGPYTGPTVGRAKQFAALAYDAVTAANISTLTGSIGVSAAAVSTITGFSAPADVKYGMDSLAPNDHLTALAQGDVTTLVGNIDPRACDADLTNVVGGLTGDITLHAGVTCMSSFSADVLLNGHVYLDARGDPNAFFIIRANNTLTVANGAQVVLTNGAQACGVFWRISKSVTIGTTAQFYGTVIAGSAITMSTGATLNGRALAQTAGIHLDANTITVGSACTHLE